MLICIRTTRQTNYAVNRKNSPRRRRSQSPPHLLLLSGEELSVAELQEILAMGQSTISTHLSQLKQAGLVEDRRTGKSNLYQPQPCATAALWTTPRPAQARDSRSRRRPGRHAPRP